MASSIRTTVHESLPYIDGELTDSERLAVESLILSDLAQSHPSSTPTPASTPLAQITSTLEPHPSLPAPHTPNFTPLIQSELARVAASTRLSGIDTNRYEIQEPPTSSDELAAPLSLAYATHTYSQSRETHLHLLDAYGKNAWLVGNWQTEAELASLERELGATKREIDVVTIGRKRLQEEVGEELRSLEDTWKKGVGRVLETEAATEMLRRQVLERQRQGA
ncbi:Pre-mRNA-splicing factor SPF27 [Astrocystis sublimbata]|nr:Pre-mRNA-splicing factor SPF27 [Astrocystis sublimbata]